MFSSLLLPALSSVRNPCGSPSSHSPHQIQAQFKLCRSALLITSRSSVFLHPFTPTASVQTPSRWGITTTDLFTFLIVTIHVNKLFFFTQMKSLSYSQSIFVMRPLHYVQRIWKTQNNVCICLSECSSRSSLLPRQKML